MSSTNAKEEFLKHTAKLNVKCAELTLGDGYSDEPKKSYAIPLGFKMEQLEAFLQSLDFEYDSGYRGQNLFGTIWYEDGTWSGRGEYDGSEWWEHHACPDIPDSLKEPK